MSDEIKGTKGMVRVNPNDVVMTSNQRIVPCRRDATPEELEEFAKELRAKKKRTAKAIAEKNKELSKDE